MICNKFCWLFITCGISYFKSANLRINAKRMETNNKGKPPSKCTPGTTVYEIFEMLEGYLS